MKELVDALAAPLQGILGYLNFSEGRPDPRVQRQWNDVAAQVVAQHAQPRPWDALQACLKARLQTLHEQQASAFRDIDQVSGVLNALFEHVVPGYRAHHADLLFHLTDENLHHPYFLARLAEATLAQRGPWNETDRIVRGVMRQVNDYVGHRPVAILENRPRGEPYPHERVRPIPLYLKGAGVAFGRFEPLVSRALDILKASERPLLADAYFDLELLDELAFDPRGYDFSHPVDKRPNYCFGEWDPHLIDAKGYYRRFVVRRIALEGLLHRLSDPKIPPAVLEEMWFDAGAVLAGIILMASGVSGSGPTALDSSATLGVLLPRVAHVRDGFYASLLKRQSGPRAQRLQDEAKLTRQPFGGARQALNQFFARQRAGQIQQRRLALLLAELGYPHAARRQVNEPEAQKANRSAWVSGAPTSARLLTELHVRLTTGRLAVDRGDLTAAARLLPEIDDLLKRAIDCGALVDPWNILGFQGQYPRSPAVEDSVVDTRIDELIHAVELFLHLHGRLLTETAARDKQRGNEVEETKIVQSMRRLAEWWDRFGTLAVNDVTHVNGAEAVASAEHVAQALARWRERSDADLAFWKKHLDGFRSPKAFALVIDALLAKQDFRAAMALLMTWLGQAEQVPLSEGDHSFHALSLRWLMGVYAWSGAGKEEKIPAAAVDLVARFFDHLEANAEEFWQVPRINPLGIDDEEELEVAEAVEDDDEESLFGAAYEGVTYRDSTDDDVESEVLDIMPQKDFDLAVEEPRLEKRLQFLATLAQMWNIGARTIRHCRHEDRPRSQQQLKQWLGRARENFRQLLGLLDTLHDHDVPKPSGSFESMVEFDKRRSIKETLLNLTLTTCLNQALAIGSLRGVVDRDEPEQAEDAPPPSWEQLVRSMERALIRKDPAKVQELIEPFLSEFNKEPLLYIPLHQGGHPRPILRASLAQTILRGLTANLPRQGLLRETWLLLQAARLMEKNQVLSGPRVTEFDRLYQIGTQAVVEAVLDSAEAHDRTADPKDRLDADYLVGVLEDLLEPFLGVWMDHSKELRLSILEAIDTDEEWERLCKFIRTYGKDLFHARFMALGNLRGILHRGVGPYLDYLAEQNDDSARLLLDDLDEKCPRADAVRFLHVILHTLVENYDFYRDYNATTTQSDYGDNLYQFLDFLRLKGRYDRQAWQLKPLNLVHEVLARRHPAAAERWRIQAEELTTTWADELLQDLAELEKKHGMRLITIRDRLQERFVQPLAIDGLCALVAPALDQAKEITDDRVIPLEEQIRPFAANPSGVGVDVPPWLARLEAEYQRLNASRTALVNLAETLFQVPKVIVPFDELESMTEEFESEEEE